MLIKRLFICTIIVIAVISFIAPFTFLKPVDTKSYSSRETPDFRSITDVKLKKITFFDFLLPAITTVNNNVMKDREYLLYIQGALLKNQKISKKMNSFIKEQQDKYRIVVVGEIADQLTLLLRHVNVVPKELVLVQAANESGWGTSRFAREGLNFFGLWCYKKGCGMVPSSRNSGATHEVTSFKSVEAAVESYVTNINRHLAYDSLRKIREQLQQEQKPISAIKLADGLLLYSERGKDYVAEIKSMLRNNAKYIN